MYFPKTSMLESIFKEFYIKQRAKCSPIQKYLVALAIQERQWK